MTSTLLPQVFLPVIFFHLSLIIQTPLLTFTTNHTICSYVFYCTFFVYHQHAIVNFYNKSSSMPLNMLLRCINLVPNVNFHNTSKLCSLCLFVHHQAPMLTFTMNDKVALYAFTGPSFVFYPEANTTVTKYALYAFTPRPFVFRRYAIANIYDK